jgi:hypothetical protein
MSDTHRSLAELHTNSVLESNSGALDRDDLLRRRKSYGSILTAASMLRAG